MGHIYENSLVSIAASDAENCNSGLPSLREPLAYNSCTLLSPSGDEFKLCMSCTAPGLKRPILDQRGWVYQERLLAPRTAHFSRTRIRLEDSNGLRCDSHPYRCKVTDRFWARKPSFRNPGISASNWKSENAVRCWGLLILTTARQS